MILTRQRQRGGGLSGLAPVPAVVRGVPPADLAEKRRICAGCSWNVDWICEHPGCLPCRQRQAGGLRIALEIASFRCAARKW